MKAQKQKEVFLVKNNITESVCIMIKRQTEQYGWEFIFPNANINAEETAEDIVVSLYKSKGICLVNVLQRGGKRGIIEARGECPKKR